ncbi:hypothetical protein PAMP_017549 [Pampus punctatissimus]
MSNFQEQSLDENEVFLPVNETSPEFLHSEREREAMEILMSFGPEDFYSSIGTECSACFLSPVEVSQITSWAQDYHCSELQVQLEDNTEDNNSDLSSSYFPFYSDVPPPNLELGWPEKSLSVPLENITVHTNPPTAGKPPVREIIRRHLQKAKQVIAIVTDRLTDGAIIGDLHNAATRGVPIYIILNQRSIQMTFTLNRLRHPNMQVRVLGGKTFCSREGRMVVGNLKDKFLLVDLETVIHGSYSLTWTDAHLHRQIVTVLHGPVVDSFDREFRILFAASLPAPDEWRVAGTHADMVHLLKDFSDLRFQNHIPLEHEIAKSPSPPADYLLDGEAMDDIQIESNPDNHLDQHEEIVTEEMPQLNNMLFDVKTPIVDDWTHNKRSNAQPSPTDPATPDIMKRVEAISRQFSKEKDTNDDSTSMCNDKEREPTQNMPMLSSSKRKKRSKSESILVKESSMDETSSKEENKPFSRSTSELLKKGSSKGAMSEISRPMMDLSVHNTDTNQDKRGVPVPRVKASCFDPGYLSSALALMKKRNDDIKSVLHKTPDSSQPRERSHSATYTFNMDGGRSLTEREGEQE